VIGNDVVDIEQAEKESNWQRRGFLDKLFTTREQDFILSSANPGQTVWVLWSMKESAYKIYNRETGIRAFMPKRLECYIEVNEKNTCSGIVTAGSFLCYCTTTIKNKMVDTIAVRYKTDLEKVATVSSGIFKDHHGLPYVLEGEDLRPVSVSHHGKCYKAVKLL
jgi:phosphopantetheinyl transferase (holo-ACP synthase)